MGKSNSYLSVQKLYCIRAGDGLIELYQSKVVQSFLGASDSTRLSASNEKSHGQLCEVCGEYMLRH